MTNITNVTKHISLHTELVVNCFNAIKCCPFEANNNTINLQLYATYDTFREMETMVWDVAISWQLQGLRGNDGVYVALTGRLPHAPRNSHADRCNYQVDPVTAMR